MSIATLTGVWAIGDVAKARVQSAGEEPTDGGRGLSRGPPISRDRARRHRRERKHWSEARRPVR